MATEPDTLPALARNASPPVAQTAPGRERAAIRNVSLLLVARGVVLAGGVASAALVPRTLGPAAYGRYDLITMLTFWFTMLGGLGLGQVVSRQAPEMEAAGATLRLRMLFGSALVVRAIGGVVVALLYFAVTRLWLREIEPLVLILLAFAVVLRNPASLCYSLFLGQGRIGRWAVPEVIRQWGSVAFALPGFLLGGFRGAVCGYLVSEVVISVLGVLGARERLSLSALRLDFVAMAPFWRVGLAFYASEIMMSAIERSGAVLLRLVTHDYAQVGMFGVSYQIFMAAVLSTNQIASSFVPLITLLRTRGEDAEQKLWVERLIKWLTVTSVLGFLGSLILGRDLAPLVLGRAYAPVYPNLVVLSATLLLVPLAHVCSVLTLTHDRPSILFKSAALKLIAFWCLGLPLTMRWGSLGACLAMGGAVAVQTAYLMIRKAALVAHAFRTWLLVVVAGLLFAPLVLLHGSLPVNVALYGVAAGGWLLLLRAVGIVSTRELRAVYGALVSRGRPDGSAGAGA
jgi:O-antigen/teichoic acid export membrane protein